MPRFTWILLLLQLAVLPLRAVDFTGQVGSIDEAQLGMDWYLLGPGEFPILPLEGVTVTVLDCEPACPDPVASDPAGWYTFPNLNSPARLRFDPPICVECKPLEPREVLLASGARTALGAKWPAGVEDTMLRYMPSTAATLYVKREGEIPGLPGAAGAASTWVVWTNGVNGWQPFLETRTFLHELMHVYERRLRLACWQRHQDIDGFVLEESWLRSYDADRALLESLGLPLEEPDGYKESKYTRARETLARFAEDYFTPEALMLEWRTRPTSARTLTYRELEQYAPNRYEWFELMVFGRYFDEKGYLQANPGASTWPGMCEPPERLAWALDRLPPLPGLSKSSGFDLPPIKCSGLDR